jgi:regulation of enolase protein 1 (concanavalin A-like superfamily)
MTSNETIVLPAIPMPLRWDVAPISWSVDDTGALTIAAGPRTDLFISPQDATATLNAPRLLFTPRGDYMLSARAIVSFTDTFDAGVLLLYSNERSWAKLCFERSPQGQPMIVSVVTQGRSDDANAFVVEGNQTYLRVARLGHAFAFHASADGARWQLIRHFTLDSAASAAAGFEAQSPTGAGCTVTFAEISYIERRLGDLRSGE